MPVASCKPAENSPQLHQEMAEGERQRHDNQEKQEIDALKKDIEALRSRLQAESDAMWKAPSDRLIEERISGTDEARRVQIVQVLISRIDVGTERKDVDRMLGEPFKSIDDKDYYLETHLADQQSKDPLGGCTVLTFENDKLASYKVVVLSANRPMEQLVKLRQWETNEARRTDIMKSIIPRIELGGSRAEVHRMIGEPLLISEDAEYYPDWVTFYVRIGRSNPYGSPDSDSYRTKFVYENDRLKEKIRVPTREKGAGESPAKK